MLKVGKYCVVFCYLTQAHSTPSVINAPRADREGTWPHSHPYRRGLASQNKKSMWDGYIHEVVLRKYNLPQLQIQCLAKCLVLNGFSININGWMNERPSSPSVGCIILGSAIETASILVFFFLQPILCPIYHLHHFVKAHFLKLLLFPCLLFKTFSSP